jgi:glucokinase
VILVGEVGAERTSVALFEAAGEDLRLLRAASVANEEYPGLRGIVRRFAAEDLPRLSRACFVVAGRPPWPVDGAELAAATGLPEVEVVREAIAPAAGSARGRLSELARRALGKGAEQA